MQSRVGDRYAKPPGFDAKADAVRRELALSRLRAHGIPQPLIDILAASGEHLFRFDSHHAEALSHISIEQRFAAIGMKSEGADSKAIAVYLVDICNSIIAAEEAQHGAEFRKHTAHDVPVPPLKLSTISAGTQRNQGLVSNGSFAASAGTSTPRKQAQSSGGNASTPRRGTPQRDQSTPTPGRNAGGARGGSTTPPRRDTSPAPTPKRVHRSPGLKSSSFYQSAAQQIKLERQHSEASFLESRRKLVARQEYDRTRSRSRSNSPGVSSAATGASATPRRQRVALWEPKHTPERLGPCGGLARSERQFLYRTFGESAHRTSYLPSQTRHEAYRATAASDRVGMGTLNPALHTAFERLDTTKPKTSNAAGNAGVSPMKPPPTVKPRLAVSVSSPQASPWRGSATVAPEARDVSPNNRTPARQSRHVDPATPSPQRVTVAVPAEKASPSITVTRASSPAVSPRNGDMQPPALDNTNNSSSQSAPQQTEHQDATPNSTPRLSVEREKKLLDDFHRILASEGLRPEGWALLSSEDQDRHFDGWHCARVMRRVVRQAYAYVGVGPLPA
jgi:hypothetical protein